MRPGQEQILKTLETALRRLYEHKGQAAPQPGWSSQSAHALGLDSLDLAELLLEVELELGLAVSGDALVQAPTFDALAARLADEAGAQ